MSDAAPAQTYENHARFVPLFHFLVLPVLLLNVIFAALRFLSGPDLGSIFGIALAIALLLLGLYARFFALQVQDRLIRLEMRWRLAEVLSTELNRRFDELTRDQLIALRFAGDHEIADLMLEVLEEDEHDRRVIKKRINDWQPDTWRA